MKQGGLYQIHENHWFMFETLEELWWITGEDYQERCHAYNSEFSVSELERDGYLIKDSCFVVLEKNGIGHKVLSTNGRIGWIAIPENMKNCFVKTS